MAAWDPEEKTSPSRIMVTLLESDGRTRVTDIAITKREGPMPDVITWRGRAFGRERVRDPEGARRWTYVEVSCVEAAT